MGEARWHFSEVVEKAPSLSLRVVLGALMRSAGERVIPLGHGDPSGFPSFRTPPEAEHAVTAAMASGKYNSYGPPNGLLSARKAVAEYLSPGVAHKVTAEDVYLTVGCNQAIEIMLRTLALACPGANVLLPKPCFPHYESVAAASSLGVRRYALLQDRGWEVDVHALQALSDHNTVAMVLINPGNPTGCVYSRSHLHEVAQTARKLGILVIADEVYERLTFGSNPFVAMGVFASVAPVVTLGSISKRWCVPGWRLGWIVTHDPNAVLENSGLTKRIMDSLCVSPDPATLFQGALPDILGKTKEDHFSKMVKLLRETADTCCKRLEEIPCITCPNKPQGSMFVMVKLNVSLLDGISNDQEFCNKLAKEESVVILPCTALGMPNWLRITFAAEPSILRDGLARLKAFCDRHSKKQ